MELKKLFFTIHGYYEMNLDIEYFESIDEIEDYAEEVIRFFLKDGLKDVQVYLSASERGELLKEMKKINS